MITSRIGQCVTLWICVAPSFGQLYLITGSPTPKHNEAFSSLLFRVGPDGVVSQPSEIAPDTGTAWIGVSYDWRKAVFLPMYPERRVFVLDLDKAAVVKQCERPKVPGAMFIDEWLSDVPGIGQMLMWRVVGDEPRIRNIQGMILDPVVSCPKSFIQVQPSETTHIVAHGAAGVADLVPGDGVELWLSDDGKVADIYPDMPPLDYELPEALRRGFKHPYVYLFINNSQVFVLSLHEEPDEKYRICVFRKLDKTWRALPVSSERLPFVRGFGKYIAVTVQSGRSERNPESAGRAEWRKTRSRMGPNLERRFINWPNVFPGRLYIYDVDSERVYPIVTSQADSEVLLVEDSTVYYRISDRLYSAAITEKGLAPGRLLAAADTVRDAHWAFIKH